MSERPTLLLQERPLIVLPQLACAVGLNEAIVLQQLHYWLSENGTAHEGHQWVYNSYDQWQVDNFPFWSVSTIRRIFADLERTGLIASRIEYDHRFQGSRRKWYTIDYDAVSAKEEEFLTTNASDAHISHDRAITGSTPSHAQLEQTSDVHLEQTSDVHLEQTTTVQNEQTTTVQNEQTTTVQNEQTIYTENTTENTAENTAAAAARARTHTREAERPAAAAAAAAETLADEISTEEPAPDAAPKSATDTDAFIADLLAFERKAWRLAEEQARAEQASATGSPPTPPPDPFGLYEQNIGLMTPLIADELRALEREYPAGWLADAIREAALSSGKSVRYVRSILERWNKEGRASARPPGRGANNHAASKRGTERKPTLNEIRRHLWGTDETPYAPGHGPTPASAGQSGKLGPGTGGG